MFSTQHDKGIMAESLSVADIKEKPFSFEWSVLQQRIGLNGEELVSPVYTNNGRGWRLQLVRCGSDLALKIGLVSSPTLPLMASYRFFCYKNSDCSIYLKGETGLFQELNTFQGYDNFLSFDAMINLHYHNVLYINNYLTNGSLKIFCEVEVFNMKQALIPPPQTILPQHTQQPVPTHAPQADFSSLLDAGHFDVTLVAGEKEFRAHKVVLSARSPIFAKMFEVDMKEKSTNKIEIEDIEAKILQKMLINMYSGDTPLLNSAADQLTVAKLRGKDESEAVSPLPADPCEEAKKLLYAADKYQIEGLVKCCEKFLSEHLTVDNVAETVLLADKHNATQLRKSCSVFIVEHRSAVSETSRWSEVLATINVIQDIYQATVEKYEGTATASKLQLSHTSRDTTFDNITL